MFYCTATAKTCIHKTGMRNVRALVIYKAVLTYTWVAQDMKRSLVGETAAQSDNYVGLQLHRHDQGTKEKPQNHQQGGDESHNSIPLIYRDRRMKQGRVYRPAGLGLQLLLNTIEGL